MEHYAIKLEARQVAEPDFPYNKEQLSTPSSVATFCKVLQDSDVEKFITIHISSQNIVNCIQVFNGTYIDCSVPIRDIVKGSILSNSPKIILVHNHPSGSLTFSEEDKNLTKGIVQSLLLFNVDVIDHLLIAGLNYVSMKEHLPEFLIKKWR